ncbi:hypothetical protein PV721_01560 [Streptomyces sp. MB09-01]|uniref:hypothetical protein n=1 Tax=Streptomyces sp. MB09-01 TaxID=3028666 RepID=UPI0029ACB349|nr:hypothetical protein [Streptomyces sp. MB09-01]MDX3533076.1 hypothetical protein [Streptomyces sp. MB09-01]
MWWSRGERRRREEEARAAAHMVTLFRNPPQEHWDRLAVAATDPDENIRWAAGEAVSEAGHAVAAHADRFAAFVARPPSGAEGGDEYRVLLALAGLGDRRAAPRLSSAFERESLPSPLDRRHAPTLAELPPATLVPALRSALRGKQGAGYRQTAIDVLTLWGAEAAPATPELIAHLDTPLARDAVRALGRIGPAAAPAADLLADFALGRRRPQGPGTSRGAAPWHGRQTAAWAHWRVTGDDAIALAVCGAAVRAGAGRPVLAHLADLGPAAAPYVDAVRVLLDSPGAWTRAGAAHAWWRITGDSAEAVPALLSAVEPARACHPAFPTLTATRHLGAIGAPAAAAETVLAEMLAVERRTTGVFSWSRVLEDEQVRRALSEALERIRQS